MLDLSKAFDSMEHSILLRKLLSLGISGPAYSWIKSSLVNHTQHTKIGAVLSSPREINYVVPQGTILGPLLFIIYINDIAECTGLQNIYLYADDCTSVFKSSSLNDTFSEASFLLPALTQYFRDNKLLLNTSKTKTMYFTKANLNRISLPNIQIDNDDIEIAHNFKLVDVTINSQLSWQHHISNSCTKLSGVSAVLCKVKRILSFSWRMKLYNAHFLPL